MKRMALLSVAFAAMVTVGCRGDRPYQNAENPNEAIGTSGKIADKTIAGSTKVALAEGAGLGVGGILTVVPDVGFLTTLSVRMIQKLSLIYGFEYSTEDEIAELERKQVRIRQPHGHHADLLRHRQGALAVVSGHHYHFEAHLLEGVYSPARSFLKTVGNRNDADDFLANRDEHRRHRGLRESFSLHCPGTEYQALDLHQAKISDTQQIVFHARPNSLPRNSLEVIRRDEL